MTWICPECSNNNADSILRCTCGHEMREDEATLQQKKEINDESEALKNLFIESSKKDKAIGLILVVLSLFSLLAFISNGIKQLLMVQRASSAAESGAAWGAIFGLILMLSIAVALWSAGKSRLGRSSLYDILQKMKSLEKSDKKFALKRLKRFKGKIDDKDFLWPLIQMLSHKNKWIAKNSMDVLHSLTDEVSIKTKEQWVLWWESKYIKE